MIDEFIGVYIVSPDGKEERVAGHTRMSEAVHTIRTYRPNQERRALGWQIKTKLEKWDGDKMIEAK